MNTTLHLTDKEAYKLVQEVFSDSYKKELREPVLILKSVISLKKMSLVKALKYCLRLSNRRARLITFLAAHYVIKIASSMNDKLIETENEISELKKQSEFIINSVQQPNEKSQALKAIAKKKNTLKEKRDEILAAIQVDLDTEVTAEIISSVGP